jgi:hypothetical protein
MKALLREFAPTVIFAIIVISMMGMTLTNLNKHISREGIQNAEVVGRLDLVDYRLNKLEEILCPPLTTSLTKGDKNGS